MCKVGGRATKYSEAEIGGRRRKSRRLARTTPRLKSNGPGPARDPSTASLPPMDTHKRRERSWFSSTEDQPRLRVNHTRLESAKWANPDSSLSVPQQLLGRKSAKASPQGNPPTAVEGHIRLHWGPCLGRGRSRLDSPHHEDLLTTSTSGVGFPRSCTTQHESRPRQSTDTPQSDGCQ